MPFTVDFEIVHKNQAEPIVFYVRNTLTQDLEDVAATSTWRLIKIDDDTLVDSGSFGPTGSVDIVQAATGIYQYTFDAAAFPYEYILSLSLVQANGLSSQDIYIKSESAKVFSYAAQLRMQIDKARKSIADNIENEDQPDFTPPIPLMYGYDSRHLIFYITRGTQLINSVSPYTGFTVDSFPFQWYGSILIDAATIYALEAQGVFAIDTDYSYSLGGNSLVISHFEKLSAQLQTLLNRFQKEVVTFKQLYRTKGGILFQFMPGGVRSARMLNSYPAGFWSRLLSSVQQ